MQYNRSAREQSRTRVFLRLASRLLSLTVLQQRSDILFPDSYAGHRRPQGVCGLAVLTRHFPYPAGRYALFNVLH